MKDRNKVIIAIIAVLLIIVIVGGSTYAYWTWVTATNEQTNITLTVNQTTEEGKLNATLTGSTQNITNLIPVSSCTDATYAIKKPLTLTYTNTTDNGAVVKGTLTVSNFTSPNGTPSSSDLGHIHYAVTTSSTNCSTDVVSGMSGTFSATSGALFSNVTLKSGIPAETTTTGSQTYYLWVWLDTDYDYQNVGSNNISDPMQDISFTLSWTGTISNET